MCNEHIYGKVCVRERERENSSCLIERSRAAEAKTVRNGLMWEVCLPPDTLVTRTGLLPRTISGSVFMVCVDCMACMSLIVLLDPEVPGCQM